MSQCSSYPEFSNLVQKFNADNTAEIAAWKTTRAQLIREYHDVDKSDPYLVSNIHRTLWIEGADTATREQLSQLILQWFRYRLVEVHRVTPDSNLTKTVMRDLVREFPNGFKIVRHRNATSLAEASIRIKSARRSSVVACYFQELYHMAINTSWLIIRAATYLWKFWNSPFFYSHRWLLSNLFWWGSLVLGGIFTLAVIWAMLREPIIQQAASVPLVGGFMANRITTMGDSIWNMTVPSLPNITHNFINQSNPMLPVLGNVLHIHNQSVNSFQAREILRVSYAAILDSKSTIKAYGWAGDGYDPSLDFPLRGELVANHGDLANLTSSLIRNFGVYESNVTVNVAGIKRVLKGSLNDLQSSRYNPDSTIDDSQDPFIHFAQGVLSTATTTCSVAALFPWNLQSGTFCVLAWTLNYMFYQEVNCVESRLYAEPEPNYCLGIFSSLSKRSGLDARRDTFNSIMSKHWGFLKEVETKVLKISQSFDILQSLVVGVETAAEITSENIAQSKHVFDLKTQYSAEMRRRWNERGLLKKLHHWWTGVGAPRESVSQRITKQKVELDMTKITTSSTFIQESISATKVLFQKTQDDIEKAKARSGDLTSFFATKFCIGETKLALERDCGTDFEFSIAIAAMVNDFAEVQNMVDPIENTGLMANQAWEEWMIKKREITTKCGSVAADVKRRFVKSTPGRVVSNAVEERHAEQTCLLNAWLEV